MTRLEILLLGDPELRVGGVPVELTARRQWSLLASLAVRVGEVCSIEQLIEDIWGATPPDTARKNIQVLVGRLRAQLPDGGACIAHRDHGYALDAGLVDVDVLAFEQAARLVRAHSRAARWYETELEGERALARWRGAALGWLVREPWAAGVTRLLESLRLDVIGELATARLELGRYEQLVLELEPVVAGNPERLELVPCLAAGLYGCGRQADALGVCRAAIVPARAHADGSILEQLVTLERDILNQSDRLGPHSRPAGPTLPVVPTPAHGMIGRRRELELVAERVESAPCVVTLLGPGGTGKTRLAVDVARRVARRFEDVAWIELTAVGSADAVATTLLGAFGITGGDTDAVDAVAQAIGTRRLLVVLDNFEHVIDAAAVVETLREACPRAAFLITSRLRLQVEGEACFMLDPLIGAALDDDVESIEAAGAVQLFRARAALVDGLVTSEPDDVRAVAQICAQVDNLPLGIELAAARTRLLTPTDIATRLESRLDLLTTRDPAQPVRQRSLHSVMEWSYDLLDQDERRMLCVLSMFVGGCALDDLLAVDPVLGATRAKQLLTSLVDHSLVVQSIDVMGRDRWTLLDTIAAFGRERLDAQVDDAAAARRRFAEQMCAVAEASNTHDTRDPAPMNRLTLEIGNVRAAIDWAIHHDGDLAHETYGQLDRYFLTRGSIVEGESLGARVLVTSSREAASRGRARSAYGYLEYLRGDLDRAVEVLRSAVEDLREADLYAELGRAHVALGDSIRMQRDQKAASTEYQRASEIAERIDDPWLRGMAHAGRAFLGSDFQQGGEALPFFESAIRNFRACHDEYWEVVVEANHTMQQLFRSADPIHVETLSSCIDRLTHGGYWTFTQMVRAFQLRAVLEIGDFEQASDLARASLGDIERTGEQNLLMFASSIAAFAHAEAGRSGDAFGAAAECLRLSVKSGNTFFIDYAAYAIARSAGELRKWALGACAIAAIRPDELLPDYSTDRHIRRMLPALMEACIAARGDDLAEEQGAMAHLEALERGRLLLDRLYASSSRLRPSA